MSRIIIGISVCLAITASATGQMPKYGVTVTADKNVDFAAFKTYSWTAGQPSAVKAIDSRVIAAVDRELSTLGMTKATSGPGDVLATYYSLSRTDANVNAKPDSQGQLPQYRVGTLVVALLNPADRHRRCDCASTSRSRSSPPLEAAIDNAVAAMFARFPTRRK